VLLAWIVDKLSRSPGFQGRPDHRQVEVALEHVAHQVLAQHDWYDDRPADTGLAPSRRVPAGIRARACDRAYHHAMSRIGTFANDDLAGWFAKSPDLAARIAGSAKRCTTRVGCRCAPARSRDGDRP